MPTRVDPPRTKAQDRRRNRFAGSAWLRSHSTLERVRGCGRPLGGLVALKLRGSVAHYAGLSSCASPWACPPCAAKIAAGRVTEISVAVCAARAAGRGVAFLTLTFSHHRGQALAALMEAQQLAYRHLTRSAGWRQLRKLYGVSVAPRVREQTWGDANGWHPHIHGALVTLVPLSEAQLAGVERVIVAEWRRALVKAGLSGSVQHAARVRAWDEAEAGTDLAGYLAKQLALEVAGGSFKEGREGRYSPFGLLACASAGEAWAVALWYEYERATAGKRTIFWPPKWEFRPQAEASDEELASAEVGGDDVAAFDQAVWRSVCADSPRGAALLEACESSPLQALRYLASVAPPGALVVNLSGLSCPGIAFPVV